MIELNLFLGVLTQIRQWLEFTKANDTRDDNEYQEALGALYTALNETRIYIGVTERRRTGLAQANCFGRDDEAEAKLSRLWMAAALKLRRYDHDLAERCMLKSDYGANPDQWSDRDIRRARIEISRVFKEARELL